MAVELERLERTRKGKKSSSFSCLLACCNAASSGARLRSLRCVTLLRVALLRLRSFAARCFVARFFATTKPCNTVSSGASLAAEEKEEP